MAFIRLWADIIAIRCVCVKVFIVCVSCMCVCARVCVTQTEAGSGVDTCNAVCAYHSILSVCEKGRGILALISALYR